MLKVIKLVIRIYIVFFFLNFVNAQTINDNYLLLNKVIELTRTESDSTYKLLKSVNSNNDKIEKYYKFKYLNEPISKVLIGYDEVKDSLIYDNGTSQKNKEHFWSLKYSVLDSSFVKKDIEYFLQLNELWKWDENKINDAVDVSEDTSLSFGNLIYKPYYSLNSKFALVQHVSAKTFTSFYIFKKDDENKWLKIGSVKNIW